MEKAKRKRSGKPRNWMKVVQARGTRRVRHNGEVCIVDAAHIVVRGTWVADQFRCRRHNATWNVKRVKIDQEALS